MIRGRLPRMVQGAAVLGAGVAGYALLIALPPDTELVEPARVVPTVTTVEARSQQGTIMVRGGGTVRPSAQVSVAPQVGGEVAWLSPAMVSGGRFNRGDPILRIETADYENAVETAKAEVAQRNVVLLEAEENTRIARAEWDRASGRGELGDQPPNPLTVRQPQLDAARAAVASAEARLDDARLALERTWVRAPFDAVVRRETVDMGQFVAPGQAVGELYGTEEVEIVVSLSDDDAALIGSLWDARAGQAATRIPALVTAEYGGARHEWNGYVDRAEVALGEMTRTVQVVVRVPNPLDPPASDSNRPPLLIGAYATVDIEGTSLDQYTVIPSSALRDGSVVWTVANDSILQVVDVTVIQEVDELAMVQGSIGDRQPVIVSILPVYTDGMTVRPVPRVTP